ncbi:hypothetical protein [Aquibacillus rhizosphaerae]|uniref:DUF3139 domain-containing protein n=1 Tax=Aquibacillus rhizosphaerae TaxID=3051431 RepID=A0ABT7L6T5_9BACI|nr:hypothetical protein [Aquibacillus sp. LR5S19]MDL4841554.1 hypothetical protein [Aquibacillus sp. LR5S19]
MKKKSAFTKTMHNSNGFIFPYIMFLAVLVLMVLTSCLSIYKNHIEMTELQLEQIKLETLLQMSDYQFSKELVMEDITEDGQLTYEYPYGFVKINYKIRGGNQLIIEYHATSDNGGNYGRIEKIEMNL